MDLIALKVTGAAIVAVLVTLQALLMLQLYGRARLFPFSKAALMAWHRGQGYAAAGLVLTIGYTCMTQLGVNWRDPRAAAHAVAGTILLVGLVAKILSVRVVPRARRLAPALGLLLVLATLATIGTTIPWYVFMWLVRGTRPIY
jgi:hypothetical protein